MSKSKKRGRDKPFYLDRGRAMISLGPISDNIHCSYDCAFCYVKDEFLSYASLTDEEIVSFLVKNRDKYKIIYISGDTDSFAPPRTERALELMKKIVKEINCDLLFTTRAVFTEYGYDKLSEIVQAQKKIKKDIYACISITRYSDDYAFLEPYPIPSPDDRINAIKRLKILGAITVLAIRPFLPFVKVDDYMTIIDKSKKYVDIVLGECFYFVRGDVIEKRIFKKGILPEYEKDILKKQKMLFDDNDEDWDVWRATVCKAEVEKLCVENQIIFSMHSDEAIDNYKKKRI